MILSFSSILFLIISSSLWGSLCTYIPLGVNVTISYLFNFEFTRLFNQISISLILFNYFCNYSELFVSQLVNPNYLLIFSEYALCYVALLSALIRLSCPLVDPFLAFLSARFLAPSALPSAYSSTLYASLSLSFLQVFGLFAFVASCLVAEGDIIRLEIMFHYYRLDLLLFLQLLRSSSYNSYSDLLRSAGDVLLMRGCINSTGLCIYSVTYLFLFLALIITINEMLAYSNLPLQLSHRPARKQHKHCSSHQEEYETGRLLISPIMTAETDDRNHYLAGSRSQNNQNGHEEAIEFGMRKYDLPCQRNCQQYEVRKFAENRPMAVKEVIPNNIVNLPQRGEKNASKNKSANKICVDHLLSYTQEADKKANARGRVDSIYERLLDQNKRNKKEPCIAAEATFKPKQLKNELSKYYAASCNDDYHENSAKSPKFTQVKPITETHHQHRSLSKRIQNGKDKDKDRVKMGLHRKLNYRLQSELAKNPKTKYQKILQEYFQTTEPTSRRQQTLTAEQVRLRKICGSNSSVFNMKLKQRLMEQKDKTNLVNPIIYGTNASSSSRKQTQGLKQQINKIQSTFDKSKTNKLDDRIIKRIQGKDQKHMKQQTKQNEKNCHQQQLKKCRTQRWMLLNFHERQQRVLSNRKQKQQLGKQMKIQKQTNTCTFKPALTKSKSLKTVHTEQMSYLDQYYQKLHRKY